MPKRDWPAEFQAAYEKAADHNGRLDIEAAGCAIDRLLLEYMVENGDTELAIWYEDSRLWRA
jgi:hypothetical protein